MLNRQAIPLATLEQEIIRRRVVIIQVMVQKVVLDLDPEQDLVHDPDRDQDHINDVQEDLGHGPNRILDRVQEHDRIHHHANVTYRFNLKDLAQEVQHRRIGKYKPKILLQHSIILIFKQK